MGIFARSRDAAPSFPPSTIDFIIQQISQSLDRRFPEPWSISASRRDFCNESSISPGPPLGVFSFLRTISSARFISRRSRERFKFEEAASASSRFFFHSFIIRSRYLSLVFLFSRDASLVYQFINNTRKLFSRRSFVCFGSFRIDKARSLARVTCHD